MSLSDELGLKQPIEMMGHEVLLNVYFTSSLIKKAATEFLSAYELTDVQFNLLMLLRYQSGDERGLTQAQLSKMMLVNRANITSLIDRMEKAGLVERTASANDRRYNVIVLTEKSARLMDEVEPKYVELIGSILNGFSEKEQVGLIGILERMRSNVV